MPLKINFHRHADLDEVHCHVTYSGPEGDFVIRGKAKLGPLRTTLKRLERKYGTAKVAGVMGCASNNIDGELQMMGCACALKQAANVLGWNPLRMVHRAVRSVSPAHRLRMLAQRKLLRNPFKRRRRAQAALPPQEQEAPQEEQEQEQEQEEESQQMESEAAGMFEIGDYGIDGDLDGDEIMGALPLIAAYQERKRLRNANKLLRSAKGGNPVSRKRIKLFSRRAKAGDPKAKKDLRALQLANRSQKLKPGLSLAQYYRAGIT